MKIKSEHVVIGSGLEAHMKAAELNGPLLSRRDAAPYYFERLPPDMRFDYLPVRFEAHNLWTDKGTYRAGIQKANIWQVLSTALCLGGKKTTFEEENRLYYDRDERVLTTTLPGGGYLEYQFDLAHIFEPDMVYGDLPPVVKDESPGKKQVIDYTHGETTGGIVLEKIHFDGDFPSVAYLYDSPNVVSSRPRKHKDFLTVSYVDESEINHPEMRSKFVRYYLEKWLKSHGYKSRYWENDVYKSGIRLFYIDREVNDIERLHYDEDEDDALQFHNLCTYPESMSFSGVHDDVLDCLLKHNIKDLKMRNVT